PLETAIAGFLRTPSPKVVRRIKGIGKVVDVREYVDELAIDDTHIATLAHAGLVGALIPIRAKVRITPPGAVKSSEVMEALCQYVTPVLAAPLPHRAIRLALHAGDGSPMQKVRVNTLSAPVHAAS